MEFLPAEMKEKVFNLLSSNILDKVVSLVCQQWADIASKLLESRIEKMRLTLTVADRIEVNSRLDPLIRNDEKEVLLAFEKSFLRNKFYLESRDFGGYGMDNFLEKVINERGCDCGDLESCILRSIFFMPCYQLLLVQIPERIIFYSMTDVILLEKDPIQYSTSVKGSHIRNVWIDNNTHTAVSVYKEFVVSQETTRALILFKVTEVNHAEKKLVLENVRRIFLPLWSCAILMLENEVCTLFTTGTVGIWKMSEDDISVSGNTCGNIETLRTMRISKMYRINNLVLVKIASDMEPTVCWTILDSKCDHEGFRLYPVALADLVKASCLEYNEDCLEVYDVFLSLNTLIIFCKVFQTDDPTINEDKIFIKRMVRSLTIEDFRDPMLFQSTFFNSTLLANDSTLLASMQINGSISTPFILDWNNQIIHLSSGNSLLNRNIPVGSLIALRKMKKNKSKNLQKRLTTSQSQVYAVRIDVINT